MGDGAFGQNAVLEPENIIQITNPQLYATRKKLIEQGVVNPEMTAPIDQPYDDSKKLQPAAAAPQILDPLEFDKSQSRRILSPLEFDKAIPAVGLGTQKLLESNMPMPYVPAPLSEREPGAGPQGLAVDSQEKPVATSAVGADIQNTLRNFVQGGIAGHQEVARQQTALENMADFKQPYMPVGKERLDFVATPKAGYTQNDVDYQKALLEKAKDVNYHETVLPGAMVVAPVFGPVAAAILLGAALGETAVKTYENTEGTPLEKAGDAVRSVTYGPLADKLKDRRQLAKDLRDRPVSATADLLMATGQDVLPLIGAARGVRGAKGAVDNVKGQYRELQDLLPPDRNSRVVDGIDAVDNAVNPEAGFRQGTRQEVIAGPDQSLTSVLNNIAAQKFDAAEQAARDMSASKKVLSPTERMEVGATVPKKTSLGGQGAVLGEQPKPSEIYLGEKPNPQPIEVVRDNSPAPAQRPFLPTAEQLIDENKYKQVQRELGRNRDPVQSLKEILSSERGSISPGKMGEVLPHLYNLGKQVLAEGITTANKWYNRMKEHLGDMWGHLKEHMGDVWQILNNERGSIKLGGEPSLSEVIREGFTSNPKRLIVKTGDVTIEEAKAVKEKIGLDVQGYKHEVTAHEIKHAEKGRASKADELRGHIPLTEQDYLLIPEVTRPENIIGKSVGKRDQKVILYEERVNGHLLLVEEVLTGRKSLNFLSMRKLKRPYTRPMLGDESPSPVSIAQDARKMTSDSSISPTINEVNGKERAGIDPITARETLKAFINNPDQAMPHLVDIGRQVMQEGYKTAHEWYGKMREYLGEHWQHFRGFIAQVWSHINNERGSVRLNGKSGEKLVNIVDHVDDPQMTLNETRELSRYLRERFRGRVVQNKDTGNNIGFYWEGIKASLKNRNTLARSIYSVLPQLIENAVYYGKEENTKAKRPMISYYEIYYSAIKLDGEIHPVKIIVDVPERGVRHRGYYYHQIKQIEVGDVVGQSRSFSQLPTPRTSTLSLSDLVVSINKSNKLVIGFDPTAGKLDHVSVSEVLRPLVNKPQEAMPHLIDIGRQVMREGYKTAHAWYGKMSEYLGDTWRYFRDFMAQIWSYINNERGSFGGIGAKTADREALSAAERMSAAGADKRINDEWYIER